MKHTGRIAIAVSLSVLVLTSLPAHDVYLMNSNHTDYNWNAPAAAYDAAMLLELDYYLVQIAATSGSPVEEQARYVPDNWWWLYLYETYRSPAQFMQLISAIHSGHITVPLNPFVTLYGALPTEAVIRAGYYPGRMEREYGIEFKLAEAIENHTNPWGLASIWAGSGVAYTWKGVCGCAQKAPVRMDDELFIWQGPDNKTLLFKWYELLGSNADWGGYSEARNNLTSPSELDDAISLTNTRQPGISVTGLFGAGWDNVSWQSTAVVDAVTAYNATTTGDTAIVSNGVDFFEALEASNETTLLNVLRGGWGNDWDMWPASLAERTSRVRRSLEQLRTAEMLCVYPQLYDETFWGPVRSDLESGLVSVWKYFEHGWNVWTGGPSLSQMQADKETWAQDMETSVADAITAAETEIRTLFATPDEDRLVVFNPLGFERTDVAQFEMTGTGPWVVTDVTTATEVPSQVYERNGKTYLRFVASQVPSLGHRVYRYTAGPGMTFTDAATVTTGTQTIESGQYRVVLGTRGEIVEATDLSSARQLAGSNGLNDYGTGTITSVVAENVGPVSATLRVDLSGPSRTVRVTLLSGVDRIEVDNAITQNVSGLQTYGFQANLAGSQIRFEEIGAIARPGLETEGGDFLQGTRASRMTLNHFVDFAVSDYHLVISNRDAYAMQVNDSTNSTFDLTGDTVHVVVTDWQQGAGTLDQAGDDLFLNRFALRGIPGVFDGAESMRTALGHQNPLHVVDLPRNQTGPIAEATGSLLSADAANVVVTAIKPAEDHGAGFIVRAWELGGSSSSFDIDASAMGADAAWHTSLIETDVSPASITNGVIQATAGANEIVTYRFTVDVSLLDTDDDGFTPADGDCDDSDPNSFPGAPELCDGNDNDCMGVIPLDEQDQDEDWYVACMGWIDDQGDDPEILGGGDCDDDDATAFPGAPELCDGEDNSCSGTADDGDADLDCDDGNGCTDDSCDPVLFCVNSAVVDGTTCDDGDACTTVDTCTSGVCGGTTPPDCDDGNVCTDDSCDSITGCVNTNNTASCDDGDACTTADTCGGGVCTGGAPPSCDDGNVCTDDSCDSLTGCVNANNTASCDDGDACTTADTCSGGECTGGAPPDCDDGNACTDDSCDSLTGCLNANNTSSCDDGDACTTADTCSGGVCTGGTPPDCDDGNACTADSCDPALGCVNTAVVDGTTCDDGDACTTVDTCTTGVCGGATPPDCDDGNACTADSCDSALGCVNPAVVDGTTCDDGDACTTVDTCTTGVCVGTTPPDCDDGNVCTDDSCDSIAGCVSTNNTASCDDGDACTTADTCGGGVCTGGTPPNCDDGNVCTDDSCDSLTGCVNANNTASCDDGDACTTADTCSGGACTGGTPPDCDDGNACTADSCDPALGCVNTAVVDGTTCDDGDACTTVDTCTTGVCGGTTPPDCDDGNACTADSCDSLTGCVNTAVVDGATCDDGDACTTVDTCTTGVCGGTTPPNCDDGNVCTDDSCDSLTGCVNTTNTASCDDGDACTTADTCSGGVCTGGTPPDCDDGNACTADSCDPALGCVNTAVVDGTTCDDGDACTTVDTCTTGVCGGTTPPDCDDGNACTADSCDSALGCVNTAVVDGTTCDDGDACTTVDTCTTGVCGGTTPPDCDDGNVCTDDSCDSVSGCVNANNTASCDDGDACTTADTCSGGVCTGGTPPDCDDGNACTADSCDPALGCVNTAVVDGTTCDDGDACTTVDTCTTGVCGGTTPPDCDDGNACTADSCDSALGCVNTAVVDGTTCDDGDACTTVDTCTTGVCGGTTPPDCDDGNVCTDDSCDSVSGCVNANNTASCDDGDACTTADTCSGGVCTGGAPPDCDDGNVCTDDSCDSLTGCLNANNTASCDDGDACTTADTCGGGVCTGGTPPDCDDGNACTADSCDPALGCVNTAVVDGTTCDDGDACTTVDTCTTGVCGGATPPDCDDGNACTADSCDSALGCVNTAVVDGTTCDDGDACTTVDTCTTGVCGGTTPPDCDDGNVCTDDSCDSLTGCVNTNNTASCDDGDACTTADTCSGGVCAGGTPPNCNDGNVCTDDSCDSLTGCVNANNTASCDDGDACTTADTCSGGVCTGGAPPDCDDGNVCTDDSCDSLTGCLNANNTASCDDGDACTTADTCGGGVCTGGVPPDCDDGNACTADSCDPALGCVNTAVVDGTTCNDGDACTTVDTCTTGVCGGTTPPDCDDGNACTADSCDSALGCVNTAVVDGTTCDDGDACTTVDTCTTGVCGGTTPPDCDDGNVCTDDSCDSLTGCVNTNNTASCDDGDACTTADTCGGGVCTGGTPPNCDDGNVCTDDSCDSLTGCVNANNTASCDDGDACTTADTCSGGVCTGGTPPDCDDGNACTADSCDPALGCVNTAVVDGTTCDDGDACTTVDTCTTGVCGGTTPPDCDDGNACTADSCDSALGCVNTAVVDGTTCDDGDACTTVDTCTTGVCGGTTPPNCDDGNVCTDDSCDSLTGCVNTNNTASCDDGDACTTADTCGGGVCTGGTPPNCDDGNVCTDDSCDSLTGCVNANNTASCDDGDACTTADTCGGGVCTGGAPPNCDDGNICTDDSCDSVSGCVNANNTASCDDGDACTTADTCSGGVCTGGAPPDCDDGNACTADSCDPALGCVNTAVVDGTTCDDGDACTTVDTCTTGVCGGATPPDCDDGNVCTDDSCDSLTGCVNTNNTASCDDGDACTTADTCSGGVCAGGAPPNCDDGNICTDDSCDSVSGCVNANNTASCDDGDACTTADTCGGGVCTGGAPPDCDDGNACTADSCDPALSCVNTAVADGTTCDDGDACTTVDTCTTGVCGGTTPPDCDDGNVCTDDSCDSLTGCVNTNNTASCDDGDACTTADTCGGGVCIGGAPPNCDDGNICTDDSCDSLTGCVNANNTASCDDGDACTTADTCGGGVCTGGTPPNCDDGNVCTDDSCDSLTGCVNANNTASCDDGDPCTTADTCSGGVCTGGAPPDCDDGNACTADSCDPALGCVNTAVVDGTTCNDGDACTTVDTCTTGVCGGTTPPDCDDGNPCTADSCDSLTGCVNTAVVDGTTCDDGDACTTADTCGGGVCTGGAPPNCDDGNVCTDDSCDSVLGCVNTNNTASCDDGDACTTTDTCGGGVCTGGAPPNCDDGNVCTDDSCDPITGCVNTDNTSSCDDGDACTTVDTCTSGVCGGTTPPNCDDGNVCTDDSCDSVTGCVNTDNTSSCDDGDACTTADTCGGGVCTGGDPPNCDDGNVCTDDSCDSVQGCVNTNNTASCDDGDACTTADTCGGGVCTGGVPPNCDDGNVCTDDSCDSITGCVNTDNTASCDDGDACTTADTCGGGVCTGGVPPNCDDGNVCTDDSCNSVLGCVNTNNTESCDDGDACTTTDTCGGGVCTGGAPPNCDDGNVCTDDSCDSITGCVNTDNTASCDDGDACTTADTCGGGVCTGGVPPNCDDGNVCTDDSCDSVAGCVNTNNTASCDDGDACTTTDICGGGVCIGGVPPNCDDGNVCTDDSCDSVAGCVNTNNTASCDDGDACTTTDTCGGGVCTGGVPPNCDDGNVCTDDSCDSVAGCVNTDNTASCDDGDACTTADTCGGGVCIGGTPPNCDDGNVCTDDSCDSITGCVNTDNTASCDDGDACTTADTCGGGVCTGGAPPNCDDGNVCTDDSCDSALGCVNTNNTASCDDGDACTTADTCGGGVCTGGVPPNCDDGNVCTDDSCDSVAGCVNTNNTASCDDGDACTTADTCSAGVCTGGAPPTCDDGNVCTDDSCDSVLGCVNANNTSSCDDGDACTTADTCGGGVCTGGAPPNCDDGNVCTDDSCDSALGCVNTNNTASCDDGDACTTADTCGGGVCTGGVPPNCDDGNVCTDDSCDSALGCVNTNNTASCDDGDACTTADTCGGGVCTGGVPPNCDDGNVCTDDSCDSALGCVNTNNTASCDDGDACTTADTCGGGVCTGGVPPNCDDGNVCTDDSCDSVAGCVNTNNTASCDDGDACTTADTCSGGACTGGTPPNCDDGNVCTDDSCDSALGCVNTNNTASCDDGDACTTADTCGGGVCTGGAPPNCDDGNVCTDDSCDSVQGCVNSPVVDGTTCDDGDACTTVDTCTSGVCGGTTPPDCDDGNPCTDDSCDPALGCVNKKGITGTNSCDDGDACNGVEICADGECTAGTPLTCNDANPCTDDSCDSVDGCVFTPDDTNSCEDRDFCNGVETCSDGICMPGTPLICDDGNSCTDDSCDIWTGCVFAPDDSNLCDDGDPCTTGDFCQSGTCLGYPTDCTDDRNREMEPAQTSKLDTLNPPSDGLFLSRAPKHVRLRPRDRFAPIRN